MPETRFVHRRSFFKLGAIVAVVVVMSTRGPVSAEPSWQAAVSPAVELTVRDADGSAFEADFQLTSPKGKMRHARVTADRAASRARVDFGGSETDKIWGVASGDFYAGMPGTWSWTCTVRGKIVAHGTFAVAHAGEGTIELTTHDAEFR